MIHACHQHTRGSRVGVRSRAVCAAASEERRSPLSDRIASSCCDAPELILVRERAACRDASTTKSNSRRTHARIHARTHSAHALAHARTHARTHVRTYARAHARAQSNTHARLYMQACTVTNAYQCAGVTHASGCIPSNPHAATPHRAHE
eukprot:1508355-Pleurochrysis_carterae.AAC.2